MSGLVSCTRAKDAAGSAMVRAGVAHHSRRAARRLGVWFMLALVSCSTRSSSSPRPGIPLTPAQAARIAHTQADSSATLERIEAWGQDDAVRERASALLTALGDEPYAHYPDFVLARRELSFFCEWNAPGKAGGKPSPALDLGRPDHPIHVIEAYARAFHEHGIEFLVVPIPRRIQVYPDRLPDFPAQGADFPGAGAATTRFLLALAERGVESIDLLPPFAAKRACQDKDDDPWLFHTNNPHWTPRGARIAADAVASYVQEMESCPPPSAQAGADFVVHRERVDFQLPPFFPEAEQPVPIWIDRVAGPDGRPADYRERASPILVLGDSHFHWYGEDLGADLGAQLYARLGVPIDTIVLNDGGSEAVWTNLVRRDDALAGKRIVIWIFDSNVLMDERLQYFELFGN